MSDKLTGHDIICISSQDWDPIWTRKQQVMSRLPENNRILYIEPPITLLSAFKDRSMWFKWRQWLKGARQKKENIFLYSPPPVLPFGNKYHWVNRLNQRWLLLFAARQARRLGMDNPLVWTYMPNSLPLAQGLNPRAIVYDCVDEHSEYSGLIDKQVMIGMERDLLAACDLVFVTAQGLYDSKKDYARRICLLPNAADVGHFALADREDTPAPPEIAVLPRPVIGFVGVIHDWVDLELITGTARSRPGWSFAIIGPVGKGVSVDGLKSLPNVHFFGRVDKENLPGYMKAFDVCLNPFKHNQLTSRVSPLKFYEYLASGRPVVSVDMPGVREFAGIIEIAGSRDDFSAAVERALEEETPEKKKHRMAVAARHSWEERVRYMSEQINEVLGSMSIEGKG